MLRYALYARKSKDDKGDVIKSIQDQLAIGRELARAQGLSVVAEYEENHSAKDPGARPVYRQMIARVKRGEVDALLVWHVNRLARNMEEAGALAQMLIDGTLKEIRTPHWTYRPGDNILPLLLEQGMSAQYSLDLSEAVRRGMNSVVEAGGWPHQAKLGYLNARDPLNPRRGVVIKDPERWDLTRRGFDLMLTGGHSVRQAVDAMNEWGLRTRPTPTRPGQPLSYALGYDVFTNPFYAGFTTHQGVVRRGLHPPMITAAEFHRLQAVVAERGRFRQRRKEKDRPSFAYTGMMTCGRCGLQVTAERHFKSGRWRVYYHCSDPYGRCSKRGLNEEDLERKIVDALETVTVDPELCELALENLARWQGEEGRGAEEILAGQAARLREVDVRRDRLLTLLLNGTLTDEAVYKEKEAQLVAERSALELGLARTRGDLAHVRAQAEAGFGFARSAREAFLVGGPQRRREIARALGARYVLKEKELTITLDPLLEQVVRFADGIEAEFEPGVRGSESRHRASFSRDFEIGRDARPKFEPPSSLIEALRAPAFPSLELA